LDVRVEALIEKKVDLHSVATALANNVLPVPGGPYRRIPLDGAYKPQNKSGLRVGNTIVSLRTFLTSERPLISSHFTFGLESRIESFKVSNIYGSILIFYYY
jgi:hypothetical protein